MRYTVFTVAALLAGLTATSAQGIASDQKQSDADDAESLTIMSVSYVIETTFLPPSVRLRYNNDKMPVMAEIAQMTPDVRTLFWLSYLQQESPAGEMHHFFTQVVEERERDAEVRKVMIEQGQTGGVDKTIQALDDEARLMDPSPHADTVSAALASAGLAQQAQAFASARSLAAQNPDADFSAIDAAFGSKTQFRAAIRDYVERTPSLIDWCKDARAKISDEDRLGYLTDKLSAMDDKEIDRLPKALKEIFVTDDFNGEMLNGGVEQFFYNSSGQYAPEVVTALQDIGLPTEAAAVQRGIDMFDKPYPADTQLRRKLYFSNDRSELSDKLDALTGDVDDGTITPALIALAKRENLLPR
jgi:hypothetical protein